jgi:hypothetical protein
MLICAVRGKSWRGVALAFAPWVFAVALVVVWAAIRDFGATGQVTALVVWAVGLSRMLPSWARRLSNWYGDQAERLGGEPEPVQPVEQPSFMQVCELRSSGLLQELEYFRRRWMRRLGRESRQVLAIYGGSLLVERCIYAHGYGHPALASPLTLVLAVVGAVALSDVGRGRIRRLRRVWKTESAAWPVGWVVLRGRTRVPGPVWTALLILLVVAGSSVTSAPSLTNGAMRAFALGAILYSVWTVRQHTDRVARLEETVLHQRIAQVLVALMPVGWWLVAAFQWLLFALGIVAFWVGEAVPAFYELGVVSVGCGWLIKIVRADWNRPQDPLIVNAREIKLATNGTILESRVGGMLWCLPFVAAVLAFLRLI